MTVSHVHTQLLKPETYPERPEKVEYRETHISRVYLTGSHAYKFKKPLDLGFLNFTSLEDRKHFCQEEVRLNRRYCPQTYLGVVSLNRQGEHFSINGPGEIVDYAVQMRRLPEERMLDRLLEHPDANLQGEMTRLAAALKRLYPQLPVYRGERPKRYLDMMRANWRENLSQSRPYIGRTLPETLFKAAQSYVTSFLTDNAPLLLQREREGLVRDCHGDLHSRNICMSDPVCIYDCIEFNRRFRLGDILADLAFLLMDLDFRGHRSLSRQLLEQVLPTLGPAEEVELLLPFYKLYRAWVRGKVQSFLLDEQGVAEETRIEASRSATRYFNLALGSLCPPGLVLTCGLMGTGKTTVARSLAETTGACLLRSDVIRKELTTPVERKDGASAAFGHGLYAPRYTRQTYETLLERAEAALRSNEMVIVDASFSLAAQRQIFARMANRIRRPCLLLDIACDRNLALQRLDARQQQGQDASDGRREIYDLQASSFQLPTEEMPTMTVDTSHGVNYNVALIVEQYLRTAGMIP